MQILRESSNASLALDKIFPSDFDGEKRSEKSPAINCAVKNPA